MNFDIFQALQMMRDEISPDSEILVHSAPYVSNHPNDFVVRMTTFAKGQRHNYEFQIPHDAKDNLTIVYNAHFRKGIRAINRMIEHYEPTN